MTTFLRFPCTSFPTSVTKFKQRFTFVLPPANLSAILDTAKVADSVLGLMPPTEAWDDWGELCLSCLFAQGLPTTTITTQVMCCLVLKAATLCVAGTLVV